MLPLPRRAALLLAFVVAGCSSAPEPPTYSEIRFTDKPPIRLDVARIEVVQAYRSPLKAPHVEHLFPVRPARAATQWARDRLRARGTTGRAEAVIRDASATETALKRTEGVRGAFTTDQAERYDATVTISVHILDSLGKELANASATVRFSRTVAEDVTLNEREREWHRMTTAMMQALDTALEGEMKTSLAAYLK